MAATQASAHTIRRVPPTVSAAAVTAGASDPARADRNQAADFDGDGRSDLVIGTPSYPTDRRSQAGAVEVAYGDGRTQRLTADLSRDHSGHKVAAESGDEFGIASTFGHFTGTRYTDLVVTTFRDSPGANSGIFLFRGGPAGLVTPGLFISQRTIDPGNGSAFSGFGFYVTAGDFNGDGISDVAVAAHHLTIHGQADSGAVFIVPGSASGLRTDKVTRFDLSRTKAFGSPPLAEEFFGYGLAAGDYNGDGYDDLAVDDSETVHGVPAAGRIRLLYGSRHGLVPSTVALDQGDAAQANAYFGTTLAAGDVTGDGIDDLVAGSPMETVRGHANAGMVTVFPGSAHRGLRSSSRQTITQDSPGVPGGGSGTDHRLGQGIAIGDVTGDAHQDIAVSVAGQSVSGHTDAGAVLLLPGGRHGVLVSDSQLLAEKVPVTGHYFGGGLTILDRAGPAKASLAIAAPTAAVDGTHGAGYVSLYRGSPGRVGWKVAHRYVLHDFPGTAEARNANLGAYLAPAQGSDPAYPAVDTLGG